MFLKADRRNEMDAVGSTRAGATHPPGIIATADAALVAPARVLAEIKVSTGLVLTEY